MCDAKMKKKVNGEGDARMGRREGKKEIEGGGRNEERGIVGCNKCGRG